MTYSTYDVSIVPMLQILDTVDALMQKLSESKGTADLDSTLHPSMKPLKFHVWAVMDAVLKLLTRVSGQEHPPYQEPADTIRDVHTRLLEVRGRAIKLDPEVINSEPKPDTVTAGIAPGRAVDVPFSRYTHSYALPNMFFHLTTVYSIMRMEGVELGKRDFFAAFLEGYLPPHPDD